MTYGWMTITAATTATSNSVPTSTLFSPNVRGDGFYPDLAERLTEFEQRCRQLLVWTRMAAADLAHELRRRVFRPKPSFEPDDPRPSFRARVCALCSAYRVLA